MEVHNAVGGKKKLAASSAMSHFSRIADGTGNDNLIFVKDAANPQRIVGLVLCAVRYFVVERTKPLVPIAIGIGG
jgi:hypothetical protein